MTDLLRTLVTATLGVEDTATEKWLEAFIAQDQNGSDRAVVRARVHWRHTDDKTREAIAMKLGFTDGGAGERWPIPERIAQDYVYAQGYINALLEEDHLGTRV